MRIINITDKKELDDFVAAQPHAQFLQSFEWGEFQAEAASKVIRLGVEEEGKLIAAAALIKKKLPLGKSYFYCPRGPVMGIKNNELRIMNELFGEIKKNAIKEGVMFWRFEPVNESMIHNSLFMIQKTIDVQPSQTLILDLRQSEEELLAQMHQKTRYNIRLAEKKGIEIAEAGAERFEEFWRLLAFTGDRDRFNLHGRSYYQAMLNFEPNFVKLLFAEYQGKPLADSLVIFFGDTATYIHGGSSNENRELMAPYALQWQTIKLAKRLGYKHYDWHGIDENKWPGVTRFKKGFGGQAITYPGTFDLAFDPLWYNVYKMARRMRRTF